MLIQRTRHLSTCSQNTAKTAGDEFRAALSAADLRVEYRLENIMASEDAMAQLLEAALIHIDINHHGDIEDAVLQVIILF